MKHNRKYNLFGGLLVSILLLTTACAGISDLDAAKMESDGRQTVTITVLPESQTGGMRATTISNGSKANVLICAVYKVSTAENGTEVYKLVTDVFQTEEVSKDGQVYYDFANQQKDITLYIEKKKKYKVAFWAQNKNATAYKTSNLESVEVNYQNATNNDELRDAFCKSIEISSETESSKAILKRPFAQINVGTTGADYKNMMTGIYVSPNRTYTQSKITLKGVAKYINVVTDEVNNTNLEESVTFSFSTIPAFMNMKEELPTNTKDAAYYAGSNSKEEFLEVELDGEAGTLPYKYSYPTKSTEEYLTETFKYLSMCYVLVPANTTVPDGMQSTVSAVLPQVQVSFAETGEDENAVNEKTPITINNVPVMRNWRTNILGGLKYMKDPTDPDPTDPDPEDPTPPDGPDDTSVFGLVNLKITLDNKYENGYIYWDTWNEVVDDETEPETGEAENNNQ